MHRKHLFLLISFLGLSAPLGVQAVPIMNENAAYSDRVTFYPDHKDPQLFYIAPNVLSVCLDGEGVPRFAYNDLSRGGGYHGIVQMTLCARYDQANLEAAKANLVTRVPGAHFTVLPFSKSKIVFNKVLQPYIVKEFCGHIAGSVNDEQTCSFRLNSLGRRVFLRQVRQRVALTMQYEYTVDAFIRKADGSLASEAIHLGIAVRIGGEELKAHPELFFDSNGRPLKPR